MDVLLALIYLIGGGIWAVKYANRWRGKSSPQPTDAQRSHAARMVLATPVWFVPAGITLYRRMRPTALRLINDARKNPSG